MSYLLFLFLFVKFILDPMPQSLERMLAQHNQSMFEYLTPRGPHRGGRPHALPAAAVNNHPKPQQHNEGYMDRVF